MSAILPTYARADVAFERGEGAKVFTDDGADYLDFGAGIGVNSLGHTHPLLVEALKDQAGKLWHTSNLYQISQGEHLARRLAEVTFADLVFFTNSGAEALECSIKMARKYHATHGAPERYRIITFEGGFHGRTLATIAAGGQEKHLAGFGPKVDGFDQVGFGDHEALKRAIGPETAAILAEPVQGEGGIRPMPNVCLRGLRELCTEHGLLLILDEVQCGMGRTGSLFAHEAAGVTPDIMAIAKAIGGGFPLGACLATSTAAAGMTAGSHGSTFGGNPLAMAVGNAVLDVMLSDGFLARVKEIAALLAQKLSYLRDQYPDIIEEIRGSGLMLGLKCKVPNTAVVAEALNQRLLTVGAGDNVVRLLPPLNLTNDELDEAFSRLERACQTLRASKAAE